MLHRAYAPLASMGFRYLATHQDVETTRRRIAKGECYVGVVEGTVVGTVLLVPPDRRAPWCDWYDRPDVAVVRQFAIEPRLQGQGLGTRLPVFAEHRAAELGAAAVSVEARSSKEVDHHGDEPHDQGVRVSRVVAKSLVS